MYADQPRTSTNIWAQVSIDYFNQDPAITQQYHELLDGEDGTTCWIRPSVSRPRKNRL